MRDFRSTLVSYFTEMLGFPFISPFVKYEKKKKNHIL